MGQFWYLGGLLLFRHSEKRVEQTRYMKTAVMRLIGLMVLVCTAATYVCGQVARQTMEYSAAKYHVRLEPSVMISMRDGVRLATDLYFPERAGGKLPVVLIRTPYDKKLWRASGFPLYRWKAEESPAYRFAAQGYIVAVQDVRGKFESEGDFKGFNSGFEPSDGYDTVDWLAAQSWSTGNVGTFGCSYLGEVQMENAKMRNPHLKAMIPQGAGGAYRHPGLFFEGALELAVGFGWFRQFGSLLRVKVEAPPNIPRSAILEAEKYFSATPLLPKIDVHGALQSLPVIDMMKKAQAPPSNFEDFVSHQSIADPWWNQFSFIRDTDHFDVPALHVNSWYDFGVAETLELFNLLRQNSDSAISRDNQFALISPTTHCGSEVDVQPTIVGQRNLGDSAFDYYGLYLRWFDHWLKGDDNGVTNMPKVQIYVMGRNEWRGEKECPPARTTLTKFYFHSAGLANSRFGDGTLSALGPKDEQPDHFVYDPRTPVPTVGGPTCCTEGDDTPPGAFDQSQVEVRGDILVYTTPELKEGIEVTGPLHVVLYVSSSARDTDFTAKLVDVYPDGKAYNIQEGILRGRYREGFTNKVWMQPDGIYKVEINLDVTSNYFGPGHRIRLEVSSSNFPRFDRNLNTGGNNYDETNWVTAANTIYHSSGHASYLLLPIIP